MAKFLCEFCPKIYTRKEYLKAHMSIHTEGAYHVRGTDWRSILMLILFLESQHKCLHCKKNVYSKVTLGNS